MEITEQNWPEVCQQLEDNDVEVVRLGSILVVGEYLIRQDVARKLVRRGRVPERLCKKLKTEGV